jgi:hypothetical protein
MIYFVQYIEYEMKRFNMKWNEHTCKDFCNILYTTKRRFRAIRAFLALHVSATGCSFIETFFFSSARYYVSYANHIFFAACHRRFRPCMFDACLFGQPCGSPHALPGPLLLPCTRNGDLNLVNVSYSIQNLDSSQPSDQIQWLRSSGCYSTVNYYSNLS